MVDSSVKKAGQLRDGFVLTAHRGACDRAPENTLLAFAAAEELGFAEAELDVQLTLDEHLVVLHDRTLERVALHATDTALVATPIEHLRWSDLRSVDLGLGQRVPEFSEVLEGTTLNLQVEIKAPRAATALSHFLKCATPDQRARCRVTSFHASALTEFLATGVDLPRGVGLLVEDLASDWEYEAQRLGVQNLLLHWPGLTRARVDELREQGYSVYASMLNDAGDLRRAITTGVEGSSTDRPALIMALLSSEV